MKTQLLSLALALVLSGPVVAQELQELAATSPNEFVQRVQQELSTIGAYKGQVDGQLTSETISAINQACAAAGLLELCQLGPLSEAGSRAVAVALAKGSPVQDEDTPALSDGAGDTSDPSSSGEDGSAKIAEVEWHSSSARNGIEIRAQRTGEETFAVIVGTADEASFTNLPGRRHLPSEQGQEWTFSATATADLSDGGTATMFIAAYDKDGRYIGELSSGTEIQSGPGAYETTGSAPEGTAEVLPYIQLRYASGQVVEDSLKLTDAMLVSKP